MKKRFTLLFFSLLLNALGNAMAVSTNLGANPWTAAGQGLAAIFNISLGFALLCFGIFVLMINSLLAREINVQRIIGNFLFMFPFSYLVDWIVTYLNGSFLVISGLFVRIVSNLLGITIVAIAVAMYQQANLILHPNDELMFTLRFKYTQGNATKAQLIAYLLPLSILSLAFYINHQWFGVGVGLLASLFLQGPIIDLTHRIFFLKSSKNKKA
ncbi:YitT family protein [Leuconostoc suionicum]|uniref:YczE/YyaS/YitT family protein n=1 Tax=Leuconostoc suionicum TaxID=1511761 RepID=UPI003748877B